MRSFFMTMTARCPDLKSADLIASIESQTSKRRLKMAASSFMLEVKEREAGQPCFIVLNTYEDIGLG